MIDSTERLVSCLKNSTHPVLFLGAGFSANCKNKFGSPLPTGRALNQSMHLKLNITDTSYELDVIAREYINQRSEYDLRDHLVENLVATEIPDFIKSIMNHDWKRIYTTNYDNVAAASRTKNTRSYSCLRNVMADVDKDKTSIIHINGLLPSENFNDLNAHIRLTRTSYLTQTFVESAWNWLLQTDLSSSSVFIFIGYSMYDIDIARLFYSNPALHGKVFFIEPQNLDSVTKREIQQYGSVLDIGVSAFSRLLDDSFSLETNFENLRSLEKFNRSDLMRPPIAEDIFNLLLYGLYDKSVEPKRHDVFTNEYCIDRYEHKKIIDLITNGHKRIFIHSDLGNGKTLLLNMLAKSLSSRNFHVYFLQQYSDLVISELSLVTKKLDNVIVVVDDIFRQALATENISKMFENVILIGCCRSTVFELNPNRVTNMLGERFSEIDLNLVTKEDLKQIALYFDAYGLWGNRSALSSQHKIDFLTLTCGGELKSIIVSLFDSPHMSQKIKSEIDIETNHNLRKLLIVVLLLNVAGLQADLTLLSNLVGFDVYRERKGLNTSNMLEFVNPKNGSVSIKSSILSEYVLQNILDVTHVIEMITQIAIRCEGLREVEGYYEQLQREVIRFSFLDKTFKRSRVGSRYVEIYDGIKHLKSLSRNPQFWLQFAIAQLECDNFPAAEIHFNTAYSHADSIKGYKTFQIDNHFARFLLLSRRDDPSYLDSFSTFMKAHKLLSKQAKSEEDGYYPYKVATLYYEFFKAKANIFSAAEKLTIKNCAQEIIDLGTKVKGRNSKFYIIKNCTEELYELIGEIEARYNI